MEARNLVKLEWKEAFFDFSSAWLLASNCKCQNAWSGHVRPTRFKDL